MFQLQVEPVGPSFTIRVPVEVIIGTVPLHSSIQHHARLGQYAGAGPQHNGAHRTSATSPERLEFFNSRMFIYWHPLLMIMDPFFGWMSAVANIKSQRRVDTFLKTWEMCFASLPIRPSLHGCSLRMFCEIVHMIFSWYPDQVMRKIRDTVVEQRLQYQLQTLD